MGIIVPRPWAKSPLTRQSFPATRRVRPATRTRLDEEGAGKHAHVNCEACHGALAQRLPAPAAPPAGLYQRLLTFAGLSLPPDPPILLHADDPTTVKPVLPDTAVLCARCHTASAAKPKGFPQVVPADHSNGMPCKDLPPAA